MSNYKIGTNDIITDIDNIIKSGTSATASNYVDFPEGVSSTVSSSIEVQTTGGKFLEGSPGQDVLETNKYTATYTDYTTSVSSATKPPWANHANVICIGGGGGGGGGGDHNSNDGPLFTPDYQNPGGGGGGGGGAAYSVSTSAIELANNTIAITVGTHGNGGAVNQDSIGSPGKQGNVSTVTIGNTTVSAAGGGGGGGGCGGYPNGDRNGPYGNMGLGGISSNTTSYNGNNGGGNSGFKCGDSGGGRANAGRAAGNLSNNIGTEYPSISGNYGKGGGGGQGGNGPATSKQPGAGGQQGFIRVYWLYDEPS